MSTFEAVLPGGELASFRPPDPDGDLELVHGWMHQPHVVPYWQLDVDGTSWAATCAGPPPTTTRRC